MEKDKAILLQEYLFLLYIKNTNKKLDIFLYLIVASDFSY